jgi:hypothetical protein
MCLSAKQVIKGFGLGKALVKRAHKDIIVYKVLVKIIDTYHASYQRSYIYHKGLNIPQNPSKRKLFEETAIFEGWLHAFIDREDAERVAEWSNEFVTKMVIPKGARYILGNNNDVCASCLKWE